MVKIDRYKYVESYISNLKRYLVKSGLFTRNELFDVSHDFRNNLIDTLPEEIGLSNIANINTPETTAREIIHELDSKKIKTNIYDFRNFIELLITIVILGNIIPFTYWVTTFSLTRTIQVTAVMLDRPFLFLSVGSFYYGILLLSILKLKVKLKINLSNSAFEGKILKGALMLPLIFSLASTLLIIGKLSFFLENKNLSIVIYDLIQVILAILLSVWILQLGIRLSSYLFKPPTKIYFENEMMYLSLGIPEKCNQLIKLLVFVYLGNVLLGMDFNQTGYILSLVLGFVLTLIIIQEGDMKNIILISSINLIQLINHIPSTSVLPFEYSENYLIQYKASYNLYYSFFDLYVHGRNLDVWWPITIFLISITFLAIKIKSSRLRFNIFKLRNNSNWGNDLKNKLIPLTVLFLIVNPFFYGVQNTSIDFEVSQGWRTNVQDGNISLYGSSIPLIITQDTRIEYNIYVNSEIFDKDSRMLFYLEYFQNTEIANITFDINNALNLIKPVTSTETKLTSRYNDEVHEFRSVINGVVNVKRNETLVFYLAVDIDDNDGDIGWLQITSTPEKRIMKILYLLISMFVFWLILPMKRKNGIDQ